MWTDDIKNYTGTIYLNGVRIDDISKIRLDKLIGDNVIKLVPEPPKKMYSMEIKKWMTVMDTSSRAFHMKHNSGICAPSRFLKAEIQKSDDDGYYVKAISERTNRLWYGFIPYDAILRMEEVKNG